MLDLEQIAKLISCGNLTTYSFVTACGMALRYRDRETQTTVRVPAEHWVWAYLVLAFITALCAMQQVSIYISSSLAVITLIVLIRLCFFE